ncbi:MAG: phosphate acyltransferase PlsX [Dethiosulfovibrio peptidovorans]|nr:MAG: phosphate acyltransferase PlsX [Dethiosulfovibrio peptidovorans]
MILALDAMGGDYGPRENCLGALMACESHSDLEVALVGRSDLIERELTSVSPEVRTRLHVVHADEAVAMGESPAKAIRSKKRSSLRVAMEMVRSGEAAGCISAGNTGAIVAGGVLVVGRISGIDRPGLGVVLPTLNKPTLLMDAGATVRCKPLNLAQFAVMGSLFMEHLLDVKNPDVRLLSNGSEEIKGDEVIAAARSAIVEISHLHFGGYIEGNAVPFGMADVVICDGFSGNVMLKSFEGLGELALKIFKDEVDRRLLAKLGLVFLLPMLRGLQQRFDYQRYGGTPLLGVNGAVIKAHGRSKAPAIASALGVGRNFVRKDGVQRIDQEVALLLPGVKA